MRALLIVNPTATATTARSREVVTSALASELKLDVASTDHRGHAAELAHQSREDGLDLVIALGGDGTVNEAVNGLLAEGVADDIPAFAVLPGGSTNVFARNLGMTNHIVEATGELLEALHSKRFRTIGLGTAVADGRAPRWFTFTAGIGFDAAVVRRVEHVRHAGTRASGTLYARSAIREFVLHERRKPSVLTLTVDGGRPISGIHFAIVSNSSPWTYLGQRPVRLSPHAAFETGLDLYAMNRARTSLVLGKALEAAVLPTGPRPRHVLSRHDVRELRFSAPHPMPFQGDGDDFGDASSLIMRSVPNALRVPQFKSTQFKSTQFKSTQFKSNS